MADKKISEFSVASDLANAIMGGFVLGDTSNNWRFSISLFDARYYTQGQIDTALAGYYTQGQVDTALAGKADVSHVSDTGNPHSVTAAQVGLGSVVDGAEPNPDVVPQAEAEAGTATTERIWTAQRVAQAIAALATGGGGTLPGYILQGTTAMPATLAPQSIYTTNPINVPGAVVGTHVHFKVGVGTNTNSLVRGWVTVTAADTIVVSIQNSDTSEVSGSGTIVAQIIELSAVLGLTGTIDATGTLPAQRLTQVGPISVPNAIVGQTVKVYVPTTDPKVHGFGVVTAAGTAYAQIANDNPDDVSITGNVTVKVESII